MEPTTVITAKDVEKGEPEVLISSNHPTPPHQTIFLSNIDQAVAFPVETLFFFDAGRRSHETSDIFDRVRRSLSEVLLDHYYFIAGRMRFNVEMNRLELFCNNAGVLFVPATSGLRLRDLGDVSLPNPSFKHLILRTDGFHGIEETPLYTVQVTRFACGGFSIGFVINHSVLDGRSASDMFENLASLCRGEGMKKTCKLNNDRTYLKARDPAQIKFVHDEYIKLADLNSTSSFSSPDLVLPPASYLQLSNTCTHTYKVFNFSSEMIGSLKEISNVSKCSTFEAIVAHIWRARTKAVFTDDPTRISSVLFATDIRSRISPPLPDGFIGNAVITARASGAVSDVVASPLSFCVEKVREAIGRVSTDEYVRSVVDWLEVHKGVPATVGGNFYLSAWWKLPFHELDFGYGQALYGGPVMSGMDEFVLLLDDGKNDGSGAGAGGINVLIVLDKEKMDRFGSHVFDF